MIVVKAPNNVPYDDTYKTRVFLAGSIEMGKAIDWQTQFTKEVEGYTNLVVLNPRRDDWDSSWVQSADNPQFSEQVGWELYHLEDADWAVFYFDPATMSPITLMELGTRINQVHNTIVCCPEGFWRKGNVDVFCQLNNIQQVDSIEELISEFKYRAM